MKKGQIYEGFIEEVDFPNKACHCRVAAYVLPYRRRSMQPVRGCPCAASDLCDLYPGR